MSFFKRHFLHHVKAIATGGASLASSKERRAHVRSIKSVRKKLGLTGHRIKNLLGRSKTLLASPAPTSAVTEGYRHNARTLSQLTGGV